MRKCPGADPAPLRSSWRPLPVSDYCYFPLLGLVQLFEPEGGRGGPAPGAGMASAWSGISLLLRPPLLLQLFLVLGGGGGRGEKPSGDLHTLHTRDSNGWAAWQGGPGT